MNISILGTGAFAKALAYTLNKNGHNVTMHCHRLETMDKLKLDNIPYDLKLGYDDLGEIIVFVTPSFALVDIAMQIKIKEDTIIINGTKGLNKEDGLFSQMFGRLFPKNPYVVLTGPTHAEELILDIPSAILCASNDEKAAKITQDIFMNDRLRVYTGDDPIGAELGGAFKNIIAMACGACDGLGYGDNTKAALMTRGLTEIARLGVVMGGAGITFAGLSGVGDLIVTCTSKHSRNRNAGYLIGTGIKPIDVINEACAVVEGYYATKYGYILSRKLNVEMPIIQVIYNVLFENKDAKAEIDKLLLRDKKGE